MNKKQFLKAFEICLFRFLELLSTIYSEQTVTHPLLKKSEKQTEIGTKSAGGLA